MKKKKKLDVFTYREKRVMEEHNGNGGSTYSSSTTYYVLFINGVEVKTFTREFLMYEYINKTYFKKEWNRDLKKIERLTKESEKKKVEAQKIGELMNGTIYKNG